MPQDLVQHRRIETEIRGRAFACGPAAAPNPMMPDSAVLKEHLDAIRTFRDEPPSHLTLEGFIAAKALIEGVRRAGTAPRRESILAALRRMDRVDLDGFVVDFKRPAREDAYVDIAMIRRNGGLLR
jgi:branched-chain amino acid transport system substrate-binding protein